MDYNLRNLGETFQFVPACLQKVDFHSRGLFSLCELRLHIPLDVQR